MVWFVDFETVSGSRKGTQERETGRPEGDRERDPTRTVPSVEESREGLTKTSVEG